jgi:hypothetical protein
VVPTWPWFRRLAGHHVLDPGNVLCRAEDQFEQLERDRADIGQRLLDDRVLERVAADIDGLVFAGAEADHAPCSARLKPDPRADEPAARRLSRPSVDELVEHRVDAIAQALQQMARARCRRTCRRDAGTCRISHRSRGANADRHGLFLVAPLDVVGPKLGSIRSTSRVW